MSANYDSDDALLLSPGLQPVNPRATPSVSPPPEVTHPVISCSSSQNVSSPSSRSRKQSNRRKKTRPSQGDFVLIRVMDPNQPEVARQVGERALNSDSESEPEDEEMDSRSPTAEAAAQEYSQAQPRTTIGPSPDLPGMAQRALDVSRPFAKPATPLQHRDSVVESDNPDPLSGNTAMNGAQRKGSDANTKLVINSSFPTRPASLMRDRSESISNGQVKPDSSTSPRIQGLNMPHRRGSSSQRLPALQTPQSPPEDRIASSPSQKQQLPSFRHLSDLAETAIQEHETQRANSIAHRHSISSAGQSPTAVTRQLSITSLSPGSTYAPLSATSPGGGADFQNRDPFLRSGHILFSGRRPSQASDTGPYSATVHSATTSDSYQSSEGLSPGAQVTPVDVRQPRLSIDSTLSRTLPPPVGTNIQHIPAHGTGGFKCEHAGCTAPPFQTQYLLK